VIEEKPLCTAIEPVQRDVMCQLDAGHRGGMHKAEGVTPDGRRWTCEWMDRSSLGALLRRAQGRQLA
jgi:hypothetical protein